MSRRWDRKVARLSSVLLETAHVAGATRQGQGQKLRVDGRMHTFQTFGNHELIRDSALDTRIGADIASVWLIGSAHSRGGQPNEMLAKSSENCCKKFTRDICG